MTKKETLQPPSLLSMFEVILSGSHHLYQDSKSWRDCAHACHVSWLEPLITMGAIEQTEVSQAWPDGPPEGERAYNYYKFKITTVGMGWWLGQYTKDVLDRGAAYGKLVEWHRGQEPQLEGKGVGASLRYLFAWDLAPIVMAGIEDGYFEFESFYHYVYDWWSKSLTVRLTAKGMRYFDSMPRLLLECA